MEGRQLSIMRHATASAGAGRDHDRPLTPGGLDEARRVGRRLRETETIPDLILSSSARRCRETCGSVVSALGAAPALEFEDALYNAGSRELLHAIQGIVDAQKLLVIAHNPGVSTLTFELSSELSNEVGGSTRTLGGGFAPATIACFEVMGNWSDLSSRTARLMRFEHAHEIGS